jgi:hypothetical protein
MCPVPPQRVLKGLNNSFVAAILCDPPETNAKRKEGFLRQMFGSMTGARFASFLGIRNPSTVPTPIPSSNGPHSASCVAFSSQGGSRKHAQATVQDNHEMVTTSSETRALTPSLVQSLNWESSQPHREGTYLLSLDDIPASEGPSTTASGSSHCTRFLPSLWPGT